MTQQTLPSPSELAEHHCEPCEGGVEPLGRKEFSVYLDQVSDWQIVDDALLKREFECRNFMDAVERINQIAQLAEKQGHHPDLRLHSYKQLTISLTTHAIGGLSVNDFVMAVQIDALLA